MWNLSGDDIERAKAELTGRRAAIQAKYDSEIKQLAADLAALETFERTAVSFLANYKGQDAGQIAETAAGLNAASGPTSADTSQSAAADPAPGGAEKGSSRWRMRLGAKDGEEP